MDAERPSLRYHAERGNEEDSRPVPHKPDHNTIMNRYLTSRSTFHTLALIAPLALALTGCQSFNPLDKATLPWIGSDKVSESRYESPARVVAIWSDASYNSAGKKPVRGFGGRLYFYNEKQKPVPVEGQLVVYAYDDTDPRGPAQQPARKYVFTPEQLTQHFSETDMGASYSIWLPWDEMGGTEKSISLVPILTASSGQVITGSQSLAMLPGTRPDAPQDEYFARVEPESAGARKSLNKVQPAAYLDRQQATPGAVATASHHSQTVSSAKQVPERMQTATIKPTGQLAKQLLARRNEVIAQRAEQRALNSPGMSAAGTRSTEPQRVEPSAALSSGASAPPSRFSKRPGESYQSRIYSGSAANPRPLPAVGG